MQKLKVIWNKTALRRQRLFSLSKQSTRRVFQELKETVFADPSAVIRHEAAFLLRLQRNPQVTRILLLVADHDPSALVRHEAIESIGDRGVRTEAVMSSLKKLQKDKNPIISETAQIAYETLLLAGRRRGLASLER